MKNAGCGLELDLDCSKKRFLTLCTALSRAEGRLDLSDVRRMACHRQTHKMKPLNVYTFVFYSHTICICMLVNFGNCDNLQNINLILMWRRTIFQRSQVDFPNSHSSGRFRIVLNATYTRHFFIFYFELNIQENEIFANVVNFL